MRALPGRYIVAPALAALLFGSALPSAARADQQRDPELKELLEKIIASRDCFADK